MLGVRAFAMLAVSVGIPMAHVAAQPAPGRAATRGPQWFSFGAGVGSRTTLALGIGYLHGIGEHRFVAVRAVGLTRLHPIELDFCVWPPCPDPPPRYDRLSYHQLAALYGVQARAGGTLFVAGAGLATASSRGGRAGESFERQRFSTLGLAGEIGAYRCYGRLAVGVAATGNVSDAEDFGALLLSAGLGRRVCPSGI